MDLEREVAMPASLARHRVRHREVADVVDGEVHFSWTQGPWFLGMASAWIIGGALTISAGAVALYLSSTALVLLLGHSLGSHRKLIHGLESATSGRSRAPS